MYIDWQAVSAVGTWVAIMVALFIPYWQNRKRLILRVNQNRCAVFDDGETVVRYIDVSAVNAGNSDIVISKWGIGVEGSSEITLYTFTQDVLLQPIFSPQLPSRLIPGEIFSCGMPMVGIQKKLKTLVQKGEIQIDDWLVLKIIDSCGKTYEKPLKLTVREMINQKNENRYK